MLLHNVTKCRWRRSYVNVGVGECIDGSNIQLGQQILISLAKKITLSSLSLYYLHNYGYRTNIVTIFRFLFQCDEFCTESVASLFLCVEFSNATQLKTHLFYCDSYCNETATTEMHPSQKQSLLIFFGEQNLLSHARHTYIYIYISRTPREREGERERRERMHLKEIEDHST